MSYSAFGTVFVGKLLALLGRPVDFGHLGTVGNQCAIGSGMPLLYASIITGLPRTTARISLLALTYRDSFQLS